MNKYFNKRIEMDGIVFDSKKEAHRYAELKILEKAGTISDLRTQVPFELIPAQFERYERYNEKGKRLKDGVRCVEQAVEYWADFVYEEDGKTVVEDTKSPATRTVAYVIKRKLMLYIYGIKVVEI